MKYTEDIPFCACGGIIKPDVVLYEEPLDGNVVQKSVQAIENAEMLIVAGTSLTVYPAAGLIEYYKGNKLVLVNRDPTAFDGRADLVIHDSLGTVFANI